MRTDLNPAQRRAAELIDGPVLVIAGAGTGKTHTLVHRLVNLVESGVEPESILLLTFTRRAATEMIERAAAIATEGGLSVSGGTFHSFANQTLRRYGGAIQLPSDFNILDTADVRQILSGIRTELKNPLAEGELPRRETLASIIGKAANQELAIEDVVAGEFPQFFALADAIRVAADRYQSYKTDNGLVDFDDLLVLLARLLDESPEARERLQARYRYVMVDEYQDTNVLQARITHRLAGERRNVMVVGDDAQSIYAFRGACPRNLFDFKDEFPEAELVTLEENYRSTQPVLDVANALMAQMSDAFHKRLFSATPGEATKPRCIEAADEREQAEYVVDEVLRRKRAGTRLSDMAVLFRASRHAFPLELELQQRDVPFVKYGGFRFTAAGHIKDVLAHVRLVEQPDDELSLTRVLVMRDGIGNVGARKIRSAVKGKPLAEALRAHPARGKTRASLAELSELIETISAYRREPARCLEAAATAFAPLLERRYDDWPRRKRDLETLVGLVERYDSLPAMLADLTLDPPSTSRAEGLATAAGDELVLSTMHSAKGLEWEGVFVIQARDGSIPMIAGFDNDDVDDETLDEELRLFYVSVTRAKSWLDVIWPRATGRPGPAWPMPSRFLTRLPTDLFDPFYAQDLI